MLVAVQGSSEPQMVVLEVQEYHVRALLKYVRIQRTQLIVAQV